MTTMKRLIGSAAAKVAALTFGLAALCATTAHAGGFDGKPLTTNDWFDVGFTSVAADTAITKDSTTGITLGAGSWTAVPTSGEAVVLSDATLSFDADTDDALILTPAPLDSSVGNETVAVRIKATAVTERFAVTDSPITAFALLKDGSDITPIAYVAGGWTNLVYDNAASLTNDWFTLNIDFSTIGGTKSIRFSIGGTVLTDTNDATWFPTANNATKITSLSFSGSGLCKTISGDSYLEAVAQVNGVNYATFADAIAEAGENDEIIVLDNTATVPAGWKIADGKLVEIVYVAAAYDSNNELLGRYEDVQSAVNAAGAVKVVMLADYVGAAISNPSEHTATVTISSGKSITLDLAGFSLGASIYADNDNRNYPHVIWVNGGSLTVIDSSEGNTGSIVNTCTTYNWSATYTTIRVDNGTFNMQGGTITATTGRAFTAVGSSGSPSTVTFASGATLNTQYLQPEGGYSASTAGIYLGGYVNLTVNGAVVTSVGRAALFVDGSDNVVSITDGVFTGASAYGAIRFDVASQNTISITGGYYSSDPVDLLANDYGRELVSDGALSGYYHVRAVAVVNKTVTTLEELRAALASATELDLVNAVVSGNIAIDETVAVPTGCAITISDGYTLSVADNGLLLNDGTISNNGTLSVTGTGFLSNPTAIENNGAVSGYPAVVDGVYTITKPMDFQWLSYLNSSSGTAVDNVVLANDIAMPTGTTFETIPEFSGTFDGNGHCVTGIVINSTANYKGIFGRVEGAEIKNATFTVNSTVGGSASGGLVGRSYGHVHIVGVTMNGTINNNSSASWATGPFVGYVCNNGSHLYIADCTNNTATTCSGQNAGLVVGTCGGLGSGKLGVYNYVNTGSLSAPNSAGTTGCVTGWGEGTIEVIDYANNGGTMSNTYGSFACDAAHIVGQGSYTKITTYFSTDYTAYYHEDEDIYNTEPPPVAKIGTTKYETLAEALSNAQDFETVVLIADAVLPSQFIFDAEKEITLDLAGHAITSTADALLNVESGALTVNDSVGGGSVFTDNRTVFCVAGGEVVVNGGRFSATQHNTVFVSDGWIAFNGGMVDMGVDSVSEYSGEDVQAYEGLGENAGYTIFAEPLVSDIDPPIYETTAVGVSSTVELDAYYGLGATLTWSSSDTSIATVDSTGLVTFTGAAGSATIYAAAQNGSYATAMVVVGTATVKNMTTGTEYVMLQTAIGDASAGDTLKLIASVSLTDAAYVPDDAEVTIDLDGFDIVNTRTGVAAAQYAIYNDGTLTITDSKDDGTTGGHVYTTNIETSGNEAVINYGTLIIEGGWFGDSDCDKTNANIINAGRAVASYGNGSATLNGGHYTALDNFTNGKYTYALYVNGADTSLTLNSADIYGTMNGVISSYNGGRIVVNDANIVFGRMDFDTYPYRLAYGYYGNIVINGGTWKTQAKVRANDSQEFCDWYKSDAITITGGKFDLQDWTDVYGIAKISGGIFNKVVPAKNLATGCICTDNLDPETKVTYPYTVFKPIAQVGDVKYGTFENAIAAAEALDPVPDIIVLDTTAEVPDGWKIVNDKLVKIVYVAQIVRTGDKYETLAAAISAAQAGDTVTILTDCTIPAHIDVNKNLTIDLNGKTVTNNVTGARAIDLTANGVSLTVLANGGGMVTPAENTHSYGFFRMQQPNTSLILDGGFYRGATDGAALFRYNNYSQSMVMSNVTAEAVGSALMINYIKGTQDSCNSIEIVGGSFSTSGTNPYTYDSEVFRLYNMNGSIKDAVIVCGVTSPSGGYNGCFNIQGNIGNDFVIEGCVISNLVSATASGQNTWANCLSVATAASVDLVDCSLYSAQYGVYVYSSGATVDIVDTDIKTDGLALYTQLAVNGSNGDNAISSGNITMKSGSVDGEIKVEFWDFDTSKYSDFYTAGIQIEGGYFKNFVVDCPDTPRTVMSVSGGYFDHEVIDRFCAEGYRCVANTDESTCAVYPYTVVPIIYVAQIVKNEGATTNTYETLQDAFDAAVDGDTIELLMDVELDSYVNLDKQGTYVIDGKGHAISMADGATFDGRGIFGFGPAGIAEPYSVAADKNYTLKNVTVTGFDAEIVRCEGVSLAFDNCVFINNNITQELGRGKVLLRIASSAITVTNCEFTDNSAFNGIYIDEQTTAAATININGNLFSGNTISGNGIVQVATAASKSDAIVGNTFSGNTLESSENVAVLYISAPVEDVSGNLFSGNTITTAASKKEAVIVLGGSSTGTVVNGNAFVDNTLGTVNNYATIYTGANCDLSGNYWGNGAAPVTLTGHDITIDGGKTPTITTINYAVAYKVNANGRGVTVTLGVAYTATFTGEAPTGVTDLVLPASITFWNSGFETALPTPDYTSGSTTFAGWKIGGTGDAIAAIPAGTTGDITLVAAWIGAQTIEVTATTNEVVAQVEIKVTDAWIEANVTNTVGDKATTEEIQAALNETADNGLKVWENYVIGQDPNTAVAVGADQGADITAMPVSNTLTVQPVDTGFTVEYSLKQVDTNGTEIATVETKQTTDFDIDLSTVESNAYYVMTATIKTDDGATVSTVTSTNVIGVMKVESGAKTTAVAVPWASYDGTNDISVADIVRTANLTLGDELKAYAPDGKYKAWKLNASKEWEPMTVVGGSSETNANDFVVARGSAVWLTRADPSQPIYLVGGVAATEKAEVPLTAGTAEDPSWNLVGSAGTEPVSVAELIPDASTGDKISVPTAYIPKEYEYVDGKGWGYWDYETYEKNGRKRTRRVFVTDDNYIPAGTGFWYLNSGNATTIEL